MMKMKQDLEKGKNPHEIKTKDFSLALSFSQGIPPKIFCTFTAYKHAPLAANKVANEVKIGPA